MITHLTQFLHFPDNSVTVELQPVMPIYCVTLLQWKNGYKEQGSIPYSKEKDVLFEEFSVTIASILKSNPI